MVPLQQKNQTHELLYKRLFHWAGVRLFVPESVEELA